jgi:soluble epoxide hydrolase / lipid-phosphate phosphatase
MAHTPITENTCRTKRHASFYLAAGPDDGPPIIFLHGWPELSLSWRHQLPVFGALGFRAVAPDLRGHGRSSIYDRHDAYCQREIVADMIELLDSLGAQKAIWVGHDWGAPVAWNIASHHPDRCHAVAALNVPYRTLELGLDVIVSLVNRETYPETDYPYGNWEYMRFYEENFDKAAQVMGANPEATIKALFRAGNPAIRGKPTALSEVRRDGGWFGGKTSAPDLPRDQRLLSETDLAAYVSAYKRTGFFGTDSLYMNHKANAAYAAEALNGGHLEMPALFLGAEHDYTCDTVTSRLAEPMHAYVRDLTEGRVPSGHWMAQECPVYVNAHLSGWIATHVREVWPFSK